MTERATEEIKTDVGFPPQVGELVIRRLYVKGLSVEEPEEHVLVEESLQYYYEVGEPGDNWMYRALAQISNAPDQNIELRFLSDTELPFLSGVDSATASSLVEWSHKYGTSRVEHTKASDADLQRFAGLALTFHQDQSRDFGQFVTAVEQAKDLQPIEKNRFVNILKAV